MAVKGKRSISRIKAGCSCSMPGVWQAVAHNQGAAVIFHSPKGCGHIARKMEIGGFYRALGRGKKTIAAYTAPLIISGLKEEHSIFGGSEMLARCIDFVMQKYQPLYVLIANSCVSGVIGDDIASVAAEAERKWDRPILTVKACGFLNGNYHGGYYDAGIALLDRFVQCRERRMDKVAVIGDHNGPGGKEFKELKRLLDYFALEVDCFFPSYASLEVIGNLSACRCTLLSMGTPPSVAWNEKLCRVIEERYGVDFFDRLPIASVSGLENWLKCLGAYLGREDLAQQAIAEERRILAENLPLIQDKLKGKKVLLFLGRSLVYLYPDWILEVIRLSGLQLCGIILACGFTDRQREEMTEVFAALTEAPIWSEASAYADILPDIDFFVATEELESLEQLQFVLPMVPPLGTNGLLELLQKMTRLAAKRRGGVIYG